MKIVVSLLVLLLFSALGLGGYYYYQQMVAAQSPSASSSQNRPQFGNAALPESEYDVLDSLDQAISLNEDTVAWLEVPGTQISASVVQAIDNDFYVRRNERKDYDVWGCYFVDYECSIGLADEFSPNTVIYGHSNTEIDSDPTQKRFSQLFSFLDADFSKKTPYLYLHTPEERTTWEVFAAFYTTTQFDYIRVHLRPSEMLDIAKKGVALSVHKYDVPLGPADKILTLSTCSTKYKSDGTGRFVVMARLVGPDEESVTQARMS